MLERTHVRERTAGHRRRNVRQTRWVTQPEARPRSRPDGYPVRPSPKRLETTGQEPGGRYDHEAPRGLHRVANLAK